MAMDAKLAAFVGVAALLTVTPGADMALVTRNALASGRRAALLTTLGINSGVLTWALASAVGLAALLRASAEAFTLLKLAGGAYLAVLGLQTLWQARGRRREAGAAPPAPPARRPPGAWAYRQGLVTNLLNPKIAVFYTAFLPQFIGPGDPVLARSLLLAGIHNVMGVAWLSAYAYLVTRAGDVLRRPRVRRLLDRVTGSVLVALGVRLAAAGR
jgi:threonine/homoserine/homoserine lactone efflux protein